MALNWNLVLMLICTVGIFAQPARTQPSATTTQTPWSLLVEGGKGTYSTDPVCDSLEHFSRSPLLFDYEQDFFGRGNAELDWKTEVTDLAVIDGRRLVQIIQNVRERADNVEKIMKRLVVQRRDAEFCAIYQQVYDAAQVKAGSASLITIDGKPVLKTLDQNGKATWNEEYWTFDTSGPIYLDLSALRKQLSDTAPQGDRLSNGPFDLKEGCYQIAIWRPEGDCNACGSQDGSVFAKLLLRNGQLRAGWVHWFPTGAVGECSP